MDGMKMKMKGMGMERKIVVAVDESEESMYALSWCLSNLITSSHQNNANCHLILLYVKPPPPIMYSPLDAAGYLFSKEDVIAVLDKYGSELVNSVMERADAVYREMEMEMEKGSSASSQSKSHVIINVEKKVGTGDAKVVICGMVEKLGADILVMGSHGYGFIKRALLGSVSDHCAKTVKCPVVVIKRPIH